MEKFSVVILLALLAVIIMLAVDVANSPNYCV